MASVIRFFAVALPLVGSVLSQSVSVHDYIPKCAVKCFADAIQSETTCAVLDAECHCLSDNLHVIAESATPCSVEACGDDATENEVLPGARAYCSAASGSVADSTAPASQTPSSAASQTSTVAEPTISQSTIPESTAQTTVPSSTTTPVIVNGAGMQYVSVYQLMLIFAGVLVLS
ncbi:hypothetical protein SAPIO_CDS10268 [Scedosporium apiospermum]|uniref:CFEM domain-containing protein n=1 Tax=Pseudallescheria apiosperma TaxID=563466 RepID=A0A084FV17_PSEDA|nr:uncharacterized protein SAPIO_CDS10268 [Scedosporium apiospermum]KEZ38929.1 hypothetical protein SAPIO_CDS10268 [Scedosporium apiospermum]